MRPSRLIRRVLARVLDTLAPEHLGDLDEEFHERVAPTRGALAAELWYAREAASLFLGVAWDGLRATPRRPDSEPLTERPSMLTGLPSDLRATTRRLLAEPTATLLVVLTLALGMGGAVAIFAVADAAFLRPLPYPDESRLVRFHTGFDGGASSVDALSPLDVRGIRARSDIVEELGVWTLGETVHRTDGDMAVRLDAPRASASLFRILGAEPAAGRVLTEQDETGGGTVVVLSHAMWIEQYGGDPAVVGRTIELDGVAHRIAGVAPAVGMLPAGVDLWRALVLGPEWYEESRWGWQFLATVGRLAPAPTLPEAERALNLSLAEETERAADGQTRVLRPLRDELVGNGRSAILMLAAAVGVLFLIACLNVLNILLARLEGRAADFGLRMALGSDVRALARLVGLESLALAVAGGLGGAVVARVAIGTISGLGLPGLTEIGPIEVGLRVGIFAAALMLGVTFAFGAISLLGALRLTRRGALGTESRRTTGGRRARLVRGGLVASQIGLSAVLLGVVGMSVTTFRAIVTHDPGFRAEGVLTAAIELPVGMPDDEAYALYSALLERARQLPDADRVGGVYVPPISGVGWSSTFDRIDPPTPPETDPGGLMRPTLPGYFQAMGIPLVEGRTFDTSDDVGSIPVVVVDETVARRFWPEGSPVGTQVLVGGLSREPATVIGVVGDVSHERPDRTDGGHVYFPLLQRPQRSLTLVVRAGGDPLALAEELRAGIRATDPRIAITDISAMESRLRDAMSGPRVGLALLGLFGALAVLLAAIGVYGVLSWSVERRTREIGTRMAMGADPRTVLSSVLAQAMRFWCVGMAVALPLGLAALAGARRLVPDLTGAAAWSYLAVPIGLALVTTIAALVPARRAIGLDPTRALRED